MVARLGLGYFLFFLPIFLSFLSCHINYANQSLAKLIEREREGERYGRRKTALRVCSRQTPDTACKTQSEPTKLYEETNGKQGYKKKLKNTLTNTQGHTGLRERKKHGCRPYEEENGLFSLSRWEEGLKAHFSLLRFYFANHNLCLSLDVADSC